MIILGAGGLAREMVASLEWDGGNEPCMMFDDVTPSPPPLIFNCPVITTLPGLREAFGRISPRFVLGVGRARARRRLFEKGIECGGEPETYISKHALVGAFDVEIGRGVCIMPLATVSASVQIGMGAFLNKAATVGHDATLGEFCVISPGARILGGATIGSDTEIGSNACILPGVQIGNNSVVGAGAVVVRDVPDNQTVAGVPAVKICDRRRQ